MARIGIFAGTFDPVHNGHLAFAAAAIKACKLDTVAFLPETQPRNKQNVTPISHRVAMLRLVTRDEPRFTMCQLDESQFSVPATLPQLRERFPGDDLTLLIGSDVALSLPHWPKIEVLYKTMHIAIGLREGHPQPSLPVPTDILPTPKAAVAASDIRSGRSHDIPRAVREYIARHHLYNSSAP